MQNRSLRKLVHQLRAKAQDLLQDLKTTKAANNQQQDSGLSFQEHIDKQLKFTKQRHQTLDPSQDIALDLAPETPLPRRSAALRNAMLLAEKEAMADAEKQPDWQSLGARYEQIFSFNEDFATDTLAAPNNEELEQLQSELENARKRVNNLEKFKKLYFDLEEQWNNSKTEAQSHFENLSNMASKLDAPQEFEQALGDYHSSYADMAKLIEGGINGNNIVQVVGNDAESKREIAKLREVAADQHRIIESLQSQLQNANTEQERAEVVDSLQEQLAKQTRFIQESETCIQLLEDELTTANAEVEQLRARVNTLPNIKTELLETRSQHDEMEIKLQAALHQNRKLKVRLQQVAEGEPSNGSAEENNKLRKELNDWESRYNELEEKFLDLKLQQ